MASRYPANTRARDVDRANTAAILDGAFGDGQLSQDEHRAMSELAAGARTLDELETLVGDLQRPADAPPDARPPRETRRHLFTAAVAATADSAAVGAFALTDSDDAQAPAPAAQPASIDLGAVAPVVIPTPVSAQGSGTERVVRGDPVRRPMPVAAFVRQVHMVLESRR